MRLAASEGIEILFFLIKAVGRSMSAVRERRRPGTHKARLGKGYLLSGLAEEVTNFDPNNKSEQRLQVRTKGTAQTPLYVKPRNSKSCWQGKPSTPKEIMNRLLFADIALLSLLLCKELERYRRKLSKMLIGKGLAMPSRRSGSAAIASSARWRIVSGSVKR